MSIRVLIFLEKNHSKVYVIIISLYYKLLLLNFQFIIATSRVQILVKYRIFLQP